MTVTGTSPSNSSSLRPAALISGASFAGLSTAWWLVRLGYRVTVVEVAPGIRKGGTPVDIREGVIDVVRRMGLLDSIVAQSLPPRATNFLNARGEVLLSRGEDAANQRGGWEIERDALLHLLWESVQGDIEFLFGDSIQQLAEEADDIAVTFASGAERRFALLLGCDGTHSAVRRLYFGPESDFSRFMNHYFSLTIIDKLLLPENSSQMFNVPGRALMLNAYNGKTDIGFCFFAEGEIGYDRRDTAAQKELIDDRFASLRWRVPELLGAMHDCENFYFDKLCQVSMPEWSRGRVALVGDAGYCPSPAAGMGGSMAILGAAALADALAQHPNDHRQAFAAYDRNLRPTVEQIQREAREFGMKLFVPDSEQALLERNQMLQGL